MGRHSSVDDEDDERYGTDLAPAPAGPSAPGPDIDPDTGPDTGLGTVAPADADPPADAAATGRHHRLRTAVEEHGAVDGPTVGSGSGRHVDRTDAGGPTADPDRPDHAAEPGHTADPDDVPVTGVAVDLTETPGDEPAPIAAPQSRAGRNLPAAIGVGVGLAAVILLTLFVYRPSFVVLVVAAVVLGCYELRTAIGTVEARPPLVPLALGGAAICVAAWTSGPNGLVIAALLTAAALVVWRLGEGAAGYARDVASSLFVLLYLPVLAGFAVLLARPDDGAARIVVFVATVVCSDTGGYAVGVWLGRHPLAPGVSRGKTWEGSAGSLVACSVAGVLFLTLVFHQPWWNGLVYGAAIMAAATLGDLGESMIKRDLGVKDMGRLLPGHGGIMDRLDSMLPCAAVAYLLLSLFA